MHPYQVKFSKVVFPHCEKLDYVLCTDAKDAEDAQEKIIELIEWMGGVHSEIIEIKKLDVMPQAGILIAAIN